MAVGSDVQATTLPNRGGLTPEQREKAGACISRYMKEPGAEHDEVIAKCLASARRGRLGALGGYHKA